MEHGITLVAILHIFVAVLLVTIVLLQDSKGGGVGGAFGGGSQTLFGATGATNFLVKVTRGLAIIFMGTCIGLTLFLSHRNNHSVIDNLPAKALAPSKPSTGSSTLPASSPAPEEKKNP